MSSRLERLVRTLRHFYGPLALPPSDAFTLFVWEILSNHSTPAKREAALQALRRGGALTADGMWKSAARTLEDSVALALSEAFVFLTRVKATLELEHRTQAESLPTVPEAQATLAARLGYGARGRHRFLQDYRRVTRRARQAMDRVFYGEEP